MVSQPMWVLGTEFQSSARVTPSHLSSPRMALFICLFNYKWGLELSVLLHELTHCCDSDHVPPSQVLAFILYTSSQNPYCLFILL